MACPAKTPSKGRGPSTRSAFVVALAIGACSPASIGSYPEGDDVNLPDRKSGDEREGGAASGNFTLTVTLSGAGAGTITSTPSGVTCLGTTCQGTFPAGTTVTLNPAPNAGSIFAAWGGQCTGSGACAPVVNDNVGVTAEFQTLAGNWTGTYTNTRVSGACTFNNNGNLTAVVAADATAISSSAQGTGFEIRNTGTCAISPVSPLQGSAPSSALTLTNGTIAGTWTFTIVIPGQGAGQLAFPFNATITGKTMTGTWTCQTCTGGFTITKP